MERAVQSADVWLRQSENDLLFARTALAEGFYAQTCFICQQVAEKALKSIVVRRARAFPFTHSLAELCKLLRVNGRLLQAAAVLDQYYVTGRYPSGAGSLAPYESLQKFQAAEAIEFAVRFVKAAKTSVRNRKRKR
jgi:HEPN domain-containing protein